MTYYHVVIRWTRHCLVLSSSCELHLVSWHALVSALLRSFAQLAHVPTKLILTALKISLLTSMVLDATFCNSTNTQSIENSNFFNK
jgi:hypothetical protein